jgi:hypothetical protein
MYRFLHRHLTPLAADMVMALWYAVLIVLVMYCSLEPQATLQYLRL